MARTFLSSGHGAARADGILMGKGPGMASIVSTLGARVGDKAGTVLSLAALERESAYGAAKGRAG